MIIANKPLIEVFVSKHAPSKAAVNKWLEKVEDASWINHNQLKQEVPSADYVGNGRYVFNVGGNNYRIVVIAVFVAGILIVRFVGTHAEYDKLKDCSTI